MTRTSLARAICVLVLGTGLAFAASPSQAHRPSNTPRYFKPSFGNQFLTYDGNKQLSAFKTNRDWPIDFIFYDHASVFRVKRTLQQNNHQGIGSRMYEPYRRSDGTKRRIDRDGGLKDPCASDKKDTHMRIYGAAGTDYFYDPVKYGNFVVASSHWDFRDGFCSTNVPPRYGYSERAENQLQKLWVNQLDQVRHPDRIKMRNKESLHFNRKDREHVWQNNGKATAIRLCDQGCPQ